MIALCAEHANKADHGAFIDDQLRQLKAKTPEREDISGRFDWRRQDFLVRLGGNFYYRPVKIFEIGSVPCAWLTRDEEGLLEVNFRMPSIANEPRASVIENFWTAPRSADEIISPPMGRKIEVKYKNGDYFKIVFRNVKQPDHIGGLYPSANPGKLAGVVDFPTTLVEVTATVPPEWIDTYLVCDDCGQDYPEDRDECPDCGCFEAEVVEVGSAGRFWGYRGLRPVLAVRQVTPEDGIRAGRVLRRWYRAKGLTKRVRHQRVDQATGRVTYRTTTVRKRLFAANRGFVTINDGPAMASQLARYLTAPPGHSAPSSLARRALPARATGSRSAGAGSSP